jgi:predicted GIY-YIG superfamily endonuclease
MKQLLLFPDPRPLVERLGRDFFRQAPESAGVYLMRDEAGTVIYVGKAKNLRKRLGCYRVANPARLRPRHLKLLRAVARIDLEKCSDEQRALARESELLRALRPRFNRAGTWPGPTRFITWKVDAAGLYLGVNTTVLPGQTFHGPLGSGAIPLQFTLLRLLWCVLYPHRGYAGMAHGWFAGRHATRVIIPRGNMDNTDLEQAAKWLGSVLAGDTAGFASWIRQRTAAQDTRFEIATREADLEQLSKLLG